MKTVYIETTIISYLTARPSRDLLAAAWQKATTRWWDERRNRYELFTSEVVLEEAALGAKEAARRRLDALSGIPLLPLRLEVSRLAKELLHEGALPAKAAVDALHVAVAAFHGVDYLLTWNCRHIDNAELKPLLRSVCAIEGFHCSEICTPLELMGESGHER